MLVGIGVVLPAVIGDPNRGWLRTKVLANRWLMWLGLISYGIYLWQIPALQILSDWHFGTWFGGILNHYEMWLPAALILTTAFAAASWYGLEKPIMRLRRLVPPRPARRADADGVPPGERLPDPEPAGVSAAP